MTKNTKKNPILLWKRIRFKLIFAFLIPVVFIIVLGFVSYQKATTQIIATYRDSVDQTVQILLQDILIHISLVVGLDRVKRKRQVLIHHADGLVYGVTVGCNDLRIP